MKKRCIKRTAAMALALVLAMSTMVMPAGAASTVSGSLNGYQATGRVSMGSTDASAQTVFGTGAQYVYVKVALHYKWGDKSYYSIAQTAHGGAAASAYVERKNMAQSCLAQRETTELSMMPIAGTLHKRRLEPYCTTQS